LKAMARKITWWAAAEILGVTDRTMRRWREKLEKDGYAAVSIAEDHGQRIGRLQFISRHENASIERVDAESGKETSGHDLAPHQMRSTRVANRDI
jgi:predicted ArsR family transcriptional regulator